MIEVPGPTRYVAPPEALTSATPAPEPPEPACVDEVFWPTYCEWQLAEHIFRHERALDACNLDKASIADLTEPDGG